MYSTAHCRVSTLFRRPLSPEDSPPCPPGSGTYDTFPSGLCTPPTDPGGAMGTAYEVPHLPSVENYHLQHPSAYAPPVVQPDRRRPALDQSLASEQAESFHSIPRYPSSLPTQTGSKRVAAATGAATANQPRPCLPPTALSTASYPSASARDDDLPQPKRLTPNSTSPPAKGESCPANVRMKHHSMSIPERISSSGGSIADFMAQVAALFWFESTKALDKLDATATFTSGVPIPPLAPAAVASQQFKKWVSNVLTTTQVTQNVAILALLYIYRLKKANPTVKGRPGSEYRLLTVALMLANKFLDDNTYTNKTWADVSGISVTEIHVMEVEFLSNMRYSLLVSAEEWNRWLDKLARFWSYLELAQRLVSPPSPLLVPTPTHRSFVSPSHSPTVPVSPGVHSAATQSFHFQSPSLAPVPPAAHLQTWTSPYGSTDTSSPLALKPEPQQLYRKRGLAGEDSSEHPAKRASRPLAGQARPTGQQLAPQPLLQQTSIALQPQSGLPHPGAAPPAPLQPPSGLPLDQSRPQVPSLTLDTAQALDMPVSQAHLYGADAVAPPLGSSMPLPPLAPGARAMSMVFPTTTYAPPPSVAATSATVTPTTSFPPLAYGTPTKRQSPLNTVPTSVPYPGSSPLVMTTPTGPTGSASGLHTPISHSPSLYLQQRNSPYKPVRHVNTLLYPPPSAFLQPYHLPNPVLPNQMHYQPLGKRSEYRTGIVPDFLGGIHRSGQPLAPQQLTQQSVVTPAPFYQQSVSQLLPQPQPQSSRAPYQSQSQDNSGSDPDPAQY